MPSPFPGMDPYLEHPAFWAPFQNALVNCLDVILRPAVTDQYRTRIRERQYRATQEQREEYIEIYRRSDDQLITLLDIVSPLNKTTTIGREAFLNTRQQAKAAGANLVEIDLVLQGRPTLDYSREGLPTWDYAVTVARLTHPERYEIYTSTLQTRLPRFRLPLASTGHDTVVDLQVAFARCYDENDFGHWIDYRETPASLHDHIAAMAYQLWQQEGCPHGHDKEHWYRAVEQLRRRTNAPEK